MLLFSFLNHSILSFPVLLWYCVKQFWRQPAILTNLKYKWLSFEKEKEITKTVIRNFLSLAPADITGIFNLPIHKTETDTFQPQEGFGKFGHKK